MWRLNLVLALILAEDAAHMAEPGRRMLLYFIASKIL